MTTMNNQEKSARRYEVLTNIAREYAKEDGEFLKFCKGSSGVTWRRLETFLKRQFEAGNVIKIVIQSASNG